MRDGRKYSLLDLPAELQPAHAPTLVARVTDRGDRTGGRDLAGRILCFHRRRAGVTRAGIGNAACKLVNKRLVFSALSIMRPLHWAAGKCPEASSRATWIVARGFWFVLKQCAEGYRSGMTAARCR